MEFVFSDHSLTHKFLKHETCNLFIIHCNAVLVFIGFAQDPVVVSPNIYKKVLLDNEFVRVIEIEMGVGESSETHSHPNHFAYVTQGGQMTINGPDGNPIVAEVKAGDVMWMDPTTHSGKNTVTTVIKAILTELKK